MYVCNLLLILQDKFIRFAAMIKITEQSIQIGNHNKINKTEPASNPELLSPKNKQQVLNFQHASPLMSKNSSKGLPLSGLALSSERHQFLLMESKVRRLNKRIKIQHELIRNKKLYSKVEEQLKAQEEIIREKKKQIIQNRIQQAQRTKKEKRQREAQSDKIIANLKLKEKKKQFILQKLLQKNKNQHEQCYQKALLQRKLLLRPINFELIDFHEKNYLRSRRNHKTLQTGGEEQQDSAYMQKSSSKNESVRYKMRQESEEKSLSLRNERSSQNSDRNKQVKSTIQQYLETRRKEQKRIEELRQLIQKQKMYGNRVEMQFHKNRAKTESVQVQKWKEKELAQQKLKQINERNRILKNMKRPILPQFFNGNLEQKKRKELERVKRSSDSPEQKMSKLNMMSEAESHQLKVRNRVEDLQRLNQINMMRAELLLSLD